MTGLRTFRTRICDLTTRNLADLAVGLGRATGKDIANIFGDNHGHPRSTLLQLVQNDLWTLQCNGALSFRTAEVPPDTGCVSCGRRTPCATNCRPDVDTAVFTVEVDWTDRTRTEAGFATFTRTADVLASDEVDATLCAAQLVGATLRPDDMVTATRLVSITL